MRLRGSNRVLSVDSLRIAHGPVTFSAAALVKSSLRFRWGDPAVLDFAIVDGQRQVQNFSVSAEAMCPAHPSGYWPSDGRRNGASSAQRLDSVSEEVALAQVVREYLRRTEGQAPFQYMGENFISSITANISPWRLQLPFQIDRREYKYACSPWSDDSAALPGSPSAVSAGLKDAPRLKIEGRFHR